MEIAIIVTGIIGICSSIFLVDYKIQLLISVFISTFILIGGVVFLSQRIAYKEALKGNNIYKMEIKYEMKDSMYVPYDTVFVLINKK